MNENKDKKRAKIFGEIMKQMKENKAKNEKDLPSNKEIAPSFEELEVNIDEDDLEDGDVVNEELRKTMDEEVKSLHRDRSKDIENLRKELGLVDDWEKDSAEVELKSEIRKLRANHKSFRFTIPKSIIREANLRPGDNLEVIKLSDIKTEKGRGIRINIYFDRVDTSLRKPFDVWAEQYYD